MTKKILFTLIATWFIGMTAHAQGFIQLGTYLVDDQGHRIIHTSDGGYVSAGSAGTKAILYKTDCAGTLVSQIEKSFSPGPAIFWDVVELADGNIVALGEAVVATPLDTVKQVLLLKANSALTEIATSYFLVNNKAAAGKAIALTPTGDLVIWGEVAGVSIDFTDAFFVRVNPTTLAPITAPAIFNGGVDLASDILRTADNHFILSGSSYFGNIFNPNAPIINIARAYKVDENGVLVWSFEARDTFLAKYGLARVAGVAQNTDSGNFMLGGNTLSDTLVNFQDPFFISIDATGHQVSLAIQNIPGPQRMYSISESKQVAGYYSMLGETNDPAAIPYPTLAGAQVYEANGQILQIAPVSDNTVPISVRDFIEFKPGLVTYLGTLPDNPISFTPDVVVATPAVPVSVVYQNCALAASLSAPGASYQWVYEGVVIPNATQGVYFPTQPGLYQLQVVDNEGCVGTSDTFRVKAPIADFDFTADNLSVSFSNTSVDATTYFWSFGDGATSTDANPVHVYATSGTRPVFLIATNACGFKDTSYQLVGVTPVVEPSWLHQFSLAPNPTTGTFTIAMSGQPQAEVEFSLFNAVGQMAASERADFSTGYLKKTFDLAELPAGIYALQIRSGKEAKYMRLVKE